MNGIKVFLIALSLVSFITVAQAQEPLRTAGGQSGVETEPQAVYPTRPIPDWLKYRGLSEKRKDLSSSHRTIKEIELWTQNAAIEVLTFSKTDYKERFAEFEPYFTKAGWKKYKGYIEKTSVLRTIQTSNYSLNSIVKGGSRVINKGAIDGKYRWLVEVPVIMSFFKVRPDDKLDVRAAQGGQVLLTIQVGRTEKGYDTNGLLIENWKTTKMY